MQYHDYYATLNVKKDSSANDIQVEGGNQALQDNDIVINGITIRTTDSTDDQLSTTLNNASAVAKAAAVNDSTYFTGVRAIVESTIVVAMCVDEARC